MAMPGIVLALFRLEELLLPPQEAASAEYATGRRVRPPGVLALAERATVEGAAGHRQGRG
ncbi:hypothetical protein ACWDZ6_26620 [Streptomyces sp. NPDC002926]